MVSLKGASDGGGKKGIATMNTHVDLFLPDRQMPERALKPGSKDKDTSRTKYANEAP